jgi:hypothetical protein
MTPERRRAIWAIYGNISRPSTACLYVVFGVAVKGSFRSSHGT